MTAREERLNARDAAYATLKRRIMLNELKPCDRITELALAQDLGCSQGAVREALLRLQEDGLVIRAGHRGTTVTPLDPEEADEIIALRRRLEMRGALRAARAATPDLLCSAVLLAGLYAYMRGRQVATALLLFLAFMVRPDNIVFLAVFAVLLVAFRQKAWGALVGFGVSFVIYFAISRWAQHPGWWPHLWFSSYDQHYNMDGFDPPFSPVVYFRIFALALARAVTINSWVGVSVLALAGWYGLDRAGFRLDRRAGILFAALVIGVLAKFTVFPIPDTRIYFPCLLPPFLLLAPSLMALWVSAGRGEPEAAVRSTVDAEDVRPLLER